ncbi:hypothetical protein, partial [Stenotrophomonas maltophilia]|uniref:hypothetical protein n=1 Tax=Stenotrophomonas maltophilia TaxID=40324 RepID=UPI00195447CA
MDYRVIADVRSSDVTSECQNSTPSVSEIPGEYRWCDRATLRQIKQGSVSRRQDSRLADVRLLQVFKAGSSAANPLNDRPD